MRSVSKRIIAIAHALRHKGTEGEEKRKRVYRELFRLIRQILNDTERVLAEVGGLSAKRRAKVEDIAEPFRLWPGRL